MVAALGFIAVVIALMVLWPHFKVRLEKKTLAVLSKQFGPSWTVRNLRLSSTRVFLDTVSWNGLSCEHLAIAIPKSDLIQARIPAKFLVEFSGLRFMGLRADNGRMDVRTLGEHRYAVSVMGDFKLQGHSLPFTLSSEIVRKNGAMTMHSFVFSSSLFQTNYDSLILFKNGTSEATGVTHILLGPLTAFLGMSYRIEGRVDLQGPWTYATKGFQGTFRLHSDEVNVDTIRVQEVDAELSIGMSQLVVHSYRAKMFDGNATGAIKASFSENRKKLEMTTFLTNANLNQMPRKPKGIAFAGRYQGSYDFSATGRSWPEVFGKM